MAARLSSRAIEGRKALSPRVWNAHDNRSAGSNKSRHNAKAKFGPFARRDLGGAVWDTARRPSQSRNSSRSSKRSFPSMAYAAPSTLTVWFHNIPYANYPIAEPGLPLAVKAAAPVAVCPRSGRPTRGRRRRRSKSSPGWPTSVGSKIGFAPRDPAKASALSSTSFSPTAARQRKVRAVPRSQFAYGSAQGRDFGWPLPPSEW